jgi:hypothetical protein
MQPLAVPLTDRIDLLERPTSYRLPDQRRSSNEGAGEVIYSIICEGQPAFRLLKLKQPRFWPGLKEQRRSSIRPRCAGCPATSRAREVSRDWTQTWLSWPKGAFLFEMGAAIVSSSDDVAYLCMENHGMLF